MACIMEALNQSPDWPPGTPEPLEPDVAEASAWAATICWAVAADVARWALGR